MKYQILADVSGDISPAVIKEYGIGLLPMEYTLQGENRVCVEMESREHSRHSMTGSARET